MKLKGKIAIVTGSSRGIGECIATRYASEGAAVAVVANSKLDRAEQVVREIEQAGGRAAAFKADISKPAECERLVAEVVDALGEVNILVNNAGVFWPKPIEDTTEEDWDGQINLNLKGCFFMAKAVVSIMKKQGSGKIINITSIAAVLGFENSAAYCASKGGQWNMTRAMCLELARHGINVNAIAPGNIKTDMNAPLREDPNYDKIQASKTPTGIGHIDPNELTGAAVFLASNESNSVHGESILVDGGWAAS